jgi:hypothetical protein
MVSILIVLAAVIIVCLREIKRSSLWYGDTVYRPILDEHNIKTQPKKSEVYGTIISDSVWAIAVCAVAIWALA